MAYEPATWSDGTIRNPRKPLAEEWDLDNGTLKQWFIRDGQVYLNVVKRTPWCDCRKKGHGFTKRDDGAWVRPCCMRREKAAWLKWQDNPATHNPETCRWCREDRGEDVGQAPDWHDELAQKRAERGRK